MDWEAFYNSFRQPDFIPGYEIQNRLGGGAFGEVYKARKHSIGKAYAIKFLKLDDEAQREVIERELEQVRHFATIDHPNLVSIEDMGTVAGVPYLVMGYAGEDTLARRMRQGSLDRRQALLYFVQACRGVLALHDRRLVHFDLKPSNIFLKGDVARVGDYGLAKLMTDGRLTLSFGRGTPYYMAPEILRSRADQRADIYSLGVILYECQAGKVPFDAPSPGGLVLRHDDVPPQFPADFPAPLRSVVERCLRLDPERRYHGVEELLTDLGQAARQGDSVVLAPVPGWDAAPGARVAAHSPPPGAPPEKASYAEVRAGARSTAQELARGAVEVARGVWDGLRSATPVGTRNDGDAAVPSIPSTPSTPSTPFVRAASAATVAEPHGAWPTAGADAPYGERLAASSPEAPTVAPPVAPEHPGTIPVPPRAAGGPFGAVAAALILAFEVPFALLASAARFTLRILHRVAGRGGALLGRVLRLVVFFAVLCALGALAAFILLLLWGTAVP